MLIQNCIESFLKYLNMTEKSEETVKGYRKELVKAVFFLKEYMRTDPHIENIGLSDLETYLEHQFKQGLSQATRSRSSYILRSFYAYCYKKEYVSRNIALNLDPVKVKRKERVYLKQKEVKLLLNEIDKELIRIAVQTIFYTGLRVSECTALKLKDIDMEKRIVHVVAGKGNKDRDIPISDKLYLILEQYLVKVRPVVESEYFFATRKTGRLSPDYINRVLKEASARLGWDNRITAHILRHSFASRLVKKEVNLVNIQKLLGHSDLRVTSIYTHTSHHALRKAVNRV